MSHHFSDASLAQLHTCHLDLQALMTAAIAFSPLDFKVIQGWRSVEEQQQLFHAGKTKIDGVTKLSLHNATPSRAVDVAPYPIDWADLERFRFLGGFILGTAAQLGLRIRWGGDWDGDGEFKDQTFNDLPHFELKEPA